MISKDTFVKTMHQLKKFDDDMNAVDEAFHKLNPDFCSFYLTTPADMVVNILEDVFEDKDNWISYFVFELNYLDGYKPGCVLDANDEEIDVSTWEKVYDFLIENMEG